MGAKGRGDGRTRAERKGKEDGARKVKYVRRFKRNRGIAAVLLLARIPRTSTGVAGRGEGRSGPTGTCIKITAPFSAGGGQHFCRRLPFIAGGCFQRELNVRPRARARKPENRREEDENGIRETVGGEEAGKAGSRFRRGWVYARLPPIEKERANERYSEKREIERRIDTKRVRRTRINGQMTTEA